MALDPQALATLGAEAERVASMAEAAPAPKPVAASLGYLRDRLDLVEHNLGTINAIVMRLGHNLGPVLTDGRWVDPDDRPVPAVDPKDDLVDPHVDDRSELAKGISDLANYANRLARMALTVGERVDAIDRALEV